MKKRVVSTALFSVSAAVLVAYVLCLAVPNFIAAFGGGAQTGLTAREIFALIVMVAEVSAIIAAGLASGILTAIGKNGGFVFGLICMLGVFEFTVSASFMGSANLGYFGLGNAAQAVIAAFRTLLLAVTAAALVIMPKGKAEYNFIVSFFSLLALCFLCHYTAHEGAGVGYTAVFAILGVLGGVLPIAEYVRIKAGNGRSLNITLLTLLTVAAQFIALCAMCTQFKGIAHLVLGMSGTVMVIIGGMLIADSNESGFIVVSFGIIAALVWLFLIFIFLNAAVGCGLLCVIADIVITGAFAIKSRANSGGSGLKLPTSRKPPEVKPKSKDTLKVVAEIKK